MTPEPFPGLSLSVPLLIIFMIIFIFIETCLWHKRYDALAVTVWLPVIALTAAGCSGIVVLFLDISSLNIPSNDSDMTGLGFILDLVLLSPWIIAFIGALICHPVFRLQSQKGWITGSLIAFALIAAIFQYGRMTEETKFVLLDPDGNPISNQTIPVLSSHFSDPHIPSSVVTRSDGTFTLWLTPGKSFFLNIVDGPLFGNVRIWNQEDPFHSYKTTLNTTCSWDDPENEQGLFPISFEIGQKKPVALILKSHTALTSSYVSTMVQSHLLEAMNGTSQIDLSQLVSNPEALNQLDLISQVMSKQPAARPALIEGLRWSGGFITRAHSATNSFYSYSDGKMDPFPALLGAWLGLPPSEAVPTPWNVPSVFRQKVDALGLRIIQVLNPYFGTEVDASSVILEMGAEGHPAIQCYAQAFPSATKRCQDHMLYNLEALKPTVSDVSWLVESSDPHLIFAGYEATTDTIKPEERALAKQRIDDALIKTTDRWDVQRGKVLSERMGQAP